MGLDGLGGKKRYGFFGLKELMKCKLTAFVAKE